MVVNKRDRWDSSSEDESNDVGLGQQTQQQQRRGKKDLKVRAEPEDDEDSGHLSTTCDKAKSISSSSAGNDLYRQHNPLLEGCRSVYDTYERVSRVSEGTYGVVWKARDLATNDIVALKQIKFDVENNSSSITMYNSTGANKEGFPIPALREISVLLALSHENIVSVKEMVVGNSYDKVFMVMEYMEFDLKEGISRFTGGALPQSEMKGILHQILSATHHMHSKWYLHRDLKTSNILVHNSGRVALCDFGLARRYQDPLRELTQLVVTLWYRSPELLFGEKKYGPAVDMWSIGCIFGELIIKEAIMQGQGELDQLDKIFELLGIPTEENWPTFQKLPNSAIFRWRPRKKGVNTASLENRFPINSPVSANQAFLDGNGFDLLKRLLTLDPSSRITAKEALEHSYFKEGVQPRTPTFFAMTESTSSGIGSQ